MPYSADAIANFFIDKALSDGKTLSPMHVQKLVFYSHGWYLALDHESRPLISERIEAWKYGPVVRSLYGEFAEFGRKAIDRKARELLPVKGESGGWGFEVVEPSIDSESPLDVDKELARAVLNRVWEVYGNLSAIQLSNMTHAENEPWRIIQKAIGEPLPKGLHIPNETIRECFQNKLKPVQPS